MFPLKRLSVFFIACLMLYSVLVMPWLGMHRVYRSLFCELGALTFGPYLFGGACSTSFQVNTELEGEKDVTIWVQKLRGRRARGALDLNSSLIGYRATAFLAALVLATPIPWKRRLSSLVAGVLLTNAFVALRVWLKIYDAFSNPPPAHFFKLEETCLGEYCVSTKEVLHWCTLTMFHAPEMNFIFPAFIWLLVTFRRSDLVILLGRQPDEASKTAPRSPGKNERV